jgi:hypothetical protein
MVVKCEASGRGFGHEDGTLMMGLVTVSGDSKERLSLSAFHNAMIQCGNEHQ